MQLGFLPQSDNDLLKARLMQKHSFAHGHIKKYPNLKR